jgi:hypothetical protein
MDSFSKYFKSLLEKIGCDKKNDLTISEIRSILSKTNEYFYAFQKGLGQTFILDDYYEYFSEFHKFWEKHHRQILNPTIDEDKCNQIAEILNNLYISNGQKLFYELYDTFSLKSEEICQIRYFSANQDFRGSRDFTELFKIYNDDPTIFEKQNIYNNSEDFLKNIGITSLSQNDKRVKYAKTSSEMLINLNINPYELFNHFNKDIQQIRQFLLSNRGSGFGNKKTDMFLRDMIVLKIWQSPRNFDKIDVASDINTIKVALRTGILKTEIPLVSSFLDVFCYQYGLIDEMNALAWRKVWEIWQLKYPNTCIESPCLIDYFVYRIIGKEFCKESLSIFKCDSENHIFKWHSARNRTCQVCKKSKATVIEKVLPCTDNEGYIFIEKSSFVTGKDAILPNIKECPFETVCKPKTIEFKKLNPPKSISILGQTGWESARTNADEGGGGLMS